MRLTCAGLIATGPTCNRRIAKRLRLVLGAALVGVVTSTALSQGQVVTWGVPAYRPRPTTAIRFAELQGQYGITSDGLCMGLAYSADADTQLLSGVRQISEGNQHAYVLKIDGSVAGRWVGFGSDFGQLNTPAGLDGVTRQVACGGDSSYALKTDGTVVAWGRDEDGTLSVPVGLGGVVELACGLPDFDMLNPFTHHVYARRSEGTLAAWGAASSSFGQTATPSGLGAVRQVACGSGFTYALTVTGGLVGWGRNTQGETNTPSGLTGVSRISCGGSFTYALKDDGTVVSWGSNAFGQRETPAGLSGVKRVSCLRNQTFVLKQDGSVAFWGERGSELGASTMAIDLVAADAAIDFAYALRSDGTLVGWGLADGGRIRTPAGLGVVTQFSCGATHTYALRSTGTVAGWGVDYYGETNTPSGLTSIRQVSCGSSFTFVLKQNGTLQGWGNNANGQTNHPVSLSGVTKIDCGGAHSYALKTDGTVVGWGYPGPGKPGTTTGDFRLVTPVGLAGVTQISCGAKHNYARKQDGTIVGWGNGDEGQTATPPGLAGVTQVACGGNFTIALKQDGSVLAWGANRYGQSTPPEGLSGVSWVAASVNSANAIALLSPTISRCSNPGGSGSASLVISGSTWQQLGVWSWSGGGPQVPGPATDVDLGTYGSVASDCSAQAATLIARSGTTLLVTPEASIPGSDHSIRVGTTANLAGRLWLLGVAGATSELPQNLDVPVLSAANVNGTFDLIQSDLPPPPGYFLTLVPQSVNNRSVLSLRLLPLPGSAELAASATGSFVGRAVAASTIDINHDGLDDLALAVDFGAAQPGLIQILLNDGLGGLGSASVLETIPPQPTCLAVGDVDGDLDEDVVVGLASDQSARVFLDDAAGGLLPATVISGIGATPTAVVVIPPAGEAAVAASSSVGVGTSGSKLKIYLDGALQQEISMAGPVATIKGGTISPSGVRGRDIATGGTRSSSVDALLAAPETGFVQVLRPQVDGLYAITQSMYLTANPVVLDMADLDGDGRDDIVATNADPVTPAAGSALPVLSIFRNVGGTFGGGIPVQPPDSSSGLSVSLIDVDNDGDRDIVSVYKRVGADSEAALLRVDTLGAGTPISIGQTTVLDASDPILSARGNLDGVGGEDLFLVNQPSGSFFAGVKEVKPYLATGGLKQGDLDRDGVVGPSDASILLLDYGPCPGCASDLDGNGEVDGGDLSFLLLLFE